MEDCLFAARVPSPPPAPPKDTSGLPPTFPPLSLACTAFYLQPLPENQCRYIFECIATAIHQIHSRGLVHHDLKCKNIVRFYDGRYYDGQKIQRGSGLMD